jgi:hypothetical protein
MDVAKVQWAERKQGCELEGFTDFLDSTVNLHFVDQAFRKICM